MNFNAPPHTAPWVVFSLYKVPKDKRFLAFKTMGLAKIALRPTSLMPFGIMLGTGSGQGFSIYPDWQRYGLLSCWTNKDAAIDFLRKSPLAKKLQANSLETWSALMQPVMARGSWGGKNPFEPAAAPLEKNEAVVVLTRARIRLQRLPEFWKSVPSVSHSTTKAPGLLAKIGIGTLPLVEQATLSVWENAASVDQFAYSMQQHRQVVGLTRKRNWYSEELFARFRPLWTEGNWDGQQVLPQLTSTLL